MSATNQPWKPSALAKQRSARRRSSHIFRMDATSLAAVFIALLFLLMPISPSQSPLAPRHGGVDLAAVSHPTAMPGARREDAILVAISRDGRIFFRGIQTDVNVLPGQIGDALNAGSERKVFLQADARAKYGDVKAVLRSISSTGIENVAFIVNQK